MQLTIGTRGSKLALWQAEYVKSLLSKKGISSEIKIIKTKGDKIKDAPFSKIKGFGFFTKEIEESLLTGEIDIAVHSAKDIPVEEVNDELAICAILKREIPNDTLLINYENYDTDRQPLFLKTDAIIGTSSERRKKEILSIRSDLVIKDLRGNLTTRVRKLNDKEYGAIIVAEAGLRRLNIDLSEFCKVLLPLDLFVPAVSQGAIAVQCRRDRPEISSLIGDIGCKKTKICVNAEREILSWIRGGCSFPLGIHFEKRAKNFRSYLFAEANGSYKKVFLESGNINDLKRDIFISANEILKKRYFVITSARRVSEESEKILLDRNIVINYSSPFYILPKKKDGNLNFGKYDWILFTSQNSVKYFDRIFHDRVKKQTIRFGAIGKKTAESVKKTFGGCDFVAKNSHAKSMAEDFIYKYCKGKNKLKILFPASCKARIELENTFKEENVKIDRIDIYDEVLKENLSLNPLARYFFFTSPLAASTILSDKRSLEIIDKEGNLVIAMGETTLLEIEKNAPSLSAEVMVLKKQSFLEAIRVVKNYDNKIKKIAKE